MMSTPVNTRVLIFTSGRSSALKWVERFKYSIDPINYALPCPYDASDLVDSSAQNRQRNPYANIKNIPGRCSKLDRYNKSALMCLEELFPRVIRGDYAGVRGIRYDITNKNCASAHDWIDALGELNYIVIVSKKLFCKIAMLYNCDMIERDIVNYMLNMLASITHI